MAVASNYSEAMDCLLDAYQTIWEELPFLGAFQELYTHRPYMKTVLSWIYQDILDFHREAMAYFRNKAWKQLFQAAWRGFRTKIDLIKGRMQRNSNLIKTEASLAEFEEVRRIHKTATDEFANQRQAEFDRRRIYVTQWIGAPNIQAIQEEHREARICPSAGSWLVTSSVFRKWIDPIYCDNPLLWITGKPGAGKTVLVSRIVDEVRQLQKPTPVPSKRDTSVAFFYCKHQTADRDSFLAVAKGLLSQLLVQNQELLQHFYEKASMSGEPSLRTKGLARELLDVALNCSKRTCLILDGLDECDRKERKDITSFMRDVVESLPPTDMAAIRCLFVCQDDGAARKDLRDIPSINIRPTDIKNDIENFCEIWKGKIEQEIGSLQGTGYDIVKIVTAKAQGMFLFAKLVMENLHEQTSMDNLLAELENFPAGLDEAYAFPHWSPQFKGATRAQRDQHSNRHEKPFVCIDTACNFSSLGFESKDALTNHLLEVHGIDMDSDLNFPQPPRKIRKIEAGSSKHQCPECLKTFTRGHNLAAHLRSHANEKPFSCSVCGMEFGRQYDKNRHENNHTGDKSFKCFGTLKTGANWGCNLAFGRADKLADHFKSKTGQQCLQPLLMEERQKAQETGNSQEVTETAIATSVGIDRSLLDGFLFQAHFHHSYQHKPNLPTIPGLLRDRQA
ncbi:hypothetical protein N0V82_007453 [Gnomoniopsis sp. IMI 355080]|nr:hypothetical protein N0V82_007453 [Gnomoniopsis sp. IMI 355080]